MTALTLVGIGPDTLEDRLEAARAAQSWPAVAIAICVAILLFWLVSRLGDDGADLATTEPKAPPVRGPTQSGVRVALHVKKADASDEPRAA